MPISLQTPAGVKHDNNSIVDPKHGYICMDIYLNKRREKGPLIAGSWQLGWPHNEALASPTSCPPFHRKLAEKRLLRDYDGAGQ